MKREIDATVDAAMVEMEAEMAQRPRPVAPASAVCRTGYDSTGTSAEIGLINDRF